MTNIWSSCSACRDKTLTDFRITRLKSSETRKRNHSADRHMRGTSSSYLKRKMDNSLRAVTMNHHPHDVTVRTQQHRTRSDTEELNIIQPFCFISLDHLFNLNLSIKTLFIVNAHLQYRLSPPGGPATLRITAGVEDE